MNTETQSYTPGPEPPWTTAVVVYRRTTVLGGVAEQPPVSLPEAKAVKDRTKSPEAEPYIQPATRLPSPAKIRARTPTKKVKITSRSPSPACFSPISSPSKSTPKRKRETTSYFFTPPPSRNEGRPEDDSSSEESSGSGESSESENGSKDAPSNAAKAPYAATLKESPEKAARPRRGAVSGLPFPPLDAPCFGLVQEQLADDPFWLLIALVFLTRVAGRVSLPVFWGIKALYLTPQALADANPSDLVDTMRHLGMASVRCAAIQRYARGWIARPPLPGVYTTVKNYPLPPEGSLEGCSNGGLPMHSQWEIGHLTQGAYAVDSWRIFCRDALLGRSKHWTGDAGGFMAVKNHSESLAGSSSSSSSDSPNSSDSEPPTDRNTDRAFQPEWMRVLPRDKELRACLRWMWMREGWDWDPLTGERAVLSEDLRCAVDEGRVGYDVHGQLQIFDGDSRPRKKKELVVEL
ncbi:hypothetical protein SBRCBS47491_004225 [Sporothrix bragantina]|uniref:Methyl-CpG-binding domain protein 4 n=1 Tax=Sporothrix bragantina TaxID=671064 RepID=A0ABP0BLZ3_9PEZI